MCLGLCSLLLIPSHSYAGAFPDYLGKWFPSVFKQKNQEGPLPEETLEAPFAGQGNAVKRGDLSDLYQDTASSDEDLSLQHRHEEQIGEWLSEVATSSLTFSMSDAPGHFDDLSRFMSAQGLEEFKAFVTKANITSAMQSRNLSLHSYAENKPLLKSSGALNGRFRWLFQVPVTITFLPEGTVGYENREPEINESIMITAQVGRARVGENNILLVETWSVRQNSN